MFLIIANGVQIVSRHDTQEEAQAGYDSIASANPDAKIEAYGVLHPLPEKPVGGEPPVIPTGEVIETKPSSSEPTIAEVPQGGADPHHGE